jgi:hypothetical protein
VNEDTIGKAIKEAERFVAAAKLAIESRRSYTIEGHGEFKSWNPRNTGAARRASMDLTRALADLRRPS